MTGDSGQRRKSKFWLVVPIAAVLALSSCGFMDDLDGEDDLDVDTDGTPVVATAPAGAASPVASPPAAKDATPEADTKDGTPTPGADATGTPAAGSGTPTAKGEQEAGAEVDAEIGILEDMETDGTTITIASVTIDQAGWVVIHRSEDGEPGEVLGHAQVEAGEHQDVQVELDTPLTEEETTVIAMLHIDAGQTGTFEFPGPDAPVMLDDEPVMQEFTVMLASD